MTIVGSEVMTAGTFSKFRGSRLHFSLVLNHWKRGRTRNAPCFQWFC